MVQTVEIIFAINIVTICFISSRTAVEAKPPKSIASKSDADVGEESYDAESYDAFISYRRSNSNNLAMLVKVLLEHKNVKALINVEDPEPDQTNGQLDVIKKIRNFILVLRKGTLDKCKGDVKYKDFLHKEIKEAVDNNLRIILIFDGFEFPNAKQFSPEIQTALKYQGVDWQHKLVDQSVQRIISYMK